MCSGCMSISKQVHMCAVGACAGVYRCVLYIYRGNDHTGYMFCELK